MCKFYIMTINSFDEITDFKDGESDEYIIEYILADDGGFCHRASPFLMKVGTVFEHEYGTYVVSEIRRQKKHIVVCCDRESMNHPSFDLLFKMKDNSN